MERLARSQVGVEHAHVTRQVSEVGPAHTRQQLVGVAVPTERERDVEPLRQLANQQRTQPETTIAVVDHPVGGPGPAQRAADNLHVDRDVADAARQFVVDERDLQAQRLGRGVTVEPAELPPQERRVAGHHVLRRVHRGEELLDARHEISRTIGEAYTHGLELHPVAAQDGANMLDVPHLQRVVRRQRHNIACSEGSGQPPDDPQA